MKRPHSLIVHVILSLTLSLLACRSNQYTILTSEKILVKNPSGKSVHAQAITVKTAISASIDTI